MRENGLVTRGPDLEHFHFTSEKYRLWTSKATETVDVTYQNKRLKTIQEYNNHL